MRHRTGGLPFCKSLLQQSEKFGTNTTRMSISIATFAYVGVEVVAASALETRWSNTRRRTQTGQEVFFIGKTIKFTAIFFPFLAAISYALSGLLTSLNIPRDHCSLPRLSWVHKPQRCFNDTVASRSAFIINAAESGIPHLSNVFNAFLVFTAVTCANTNLFVASRSLFGLTARLDGGSRQKWYIRFLAFFGKTNRHKVPMRAVVFSAVVFCWVPPLQVLGKKRQTSAGEVEGANDKVGRHLLNISETHSNLRVQFIEVLAQMGSVGVILVWACNCWAFIRYFNW